MFSALFYFPTTNHRDRTTLTTLLLFLIHQIVFPQEFQCFHIICTCDSNFTVRKFSVVLHALLSTFWLKLFQYNYKLYASNSTLFIIIIIIIITINLFIVDNKNTIKKIFLSTNVALKTWLI